MDAETMPFRKHTFELSAEEVDILSKISCYEIRRCLKLGDVVDVDSIVINGEVFHLASDLLSSDGQDKHKEIPQTENFWRDLFSMLYRVLDEEFSVQEIDAQVELFLQEAEANTPLTPQMKEKIPCLTILALMTNSCWLRGHAYIMEFFTPLCHFPYRLTFKKGIECSIVIGAEGFQIAQKKIYNVCRDTKLETAADVELRKQAETHPLAQIPFSWSVEYANGSWYGHLQILNPAAIDIAADSLFKLMPFASEEEEWFINTALSNTTNIALRVPQKYLVQAEMLLEPAK
jgi:hypothetical protein